MPKRVQKRVQIKQETHKIIKNQRDNYKDDSCRDTIYQFAPIRTSPQNPLNIKPSVDSQFDMVRVRSLTAAHHDG